MSPHGIGLYAGAALVVGGGLRTLALTAPGGPDGGPREALTALARRRPWVTLALFAVLAVMAVVQYAAPGVVDGLGRRPGALTDGQWWRAGTALLVQSSGAAQIAVNLPALLVVGAVAEPVLGRWRTLAVFLASGVLAQAVSLAGWSVRGGGDSVAICGLLGALAVALLAAGPLAEARWALLVPAGGVLLCALHNNHGAGLLAGCLLGLALLPRTGPAPLTAR
ncbi:rhomboid family intramembrane serine protease [Kitasatospora sp. NPDC059646]|uniref:rhomboid family intramembrane serine protease n=1 Tax=Kitasatospora sp. NPDC059646 TaxID=3346893 RepID=UPI0036BF9D5C